MANKIKVSIVMLVSVFSFAFMIYENPVDREIFSIQDGSVVNKAPEFELKSTTGKAIKLSDFKGKIVIVDFWATWCPPCRKGIPDLIDLQNKYKDKLIIIGISVDQEKTINDVKPFVKKYGINYPVVYSDNKVITDFGGIESIPTSFIIDQKGNVVNKHIGLYPKYVYEEEIKELLSKS